MTRLALAALLALAACKSSAPYTLPAAALNTGIAAAISGTQRASGGCYAVCTNGTVCNPRTGWCEKGPAPGDYCEEAPGGGMRCVPIGPPVVAQDQKAAGAGTPAVGIGVSPATGQAPPPPAEASPRGP
ncbi:MAG TPA: hypothetical protein VLU43_05555 [Anaeromyxobacteraceae bacterium]|nr:hypothetical protein [Anaeromyxobacteraceae bacterium]